ncbi:MAG TPA: type II secretion system protein [Thermoanaerobaculia bacterium]
MLPTDPATSPRARRSSLIARHAQKGFSLIELIVVVTIIGILAGIALINVRTAQTKAREAALKENLFQMRKAIDNFYADKQRYPSSLEELVPNYMRKIPSDPITMQADWETVMDDPLSQDGEMSADTDPNAMTQPGVVDVKSRAEGQTLDNVPYSEL